MKRETALEIIRVEVAKYGEITSKAIRTYVENRISRNSYNLAIDKGMKQFTKIQGVKDA